MTEQMCLMHRAVHDILRDYSGMEPRLQLAFGVLFINIADALEPGADADRRHHAREAVLDVLSLFPGLIEEAVS